jgi:hypothetical protein
LNIANDEQIPVKKEIHSAKPSRHLEDDDEFDDPVLLNQQLNKQKGGKDKGMNINNIPPNQRNVKPDIKLPNRGNIPEGYDANQMGMPPANNQIPMEDNKLHFAFYEIFMFVFVTLFVLNCYLGKSKNESYAQRWYLSNREFIEDSYAHLGHGTEYNAAGGVPILKESYYNFKFYASGRVFIKWLLVTMDVNIFIIIY